MHRTPCPRLAAAVVVSLVLVLATGPAAAEDHVQPTDAISVDDVDTGRLRIPLTVDDGWSITAVELIDVKWKSRHDDALRAGFGVPVLGPDGQEVLLPVERDKLVQAGRYEIKLRFRVRAIVPAAPPAPPPMVTDGPAVVGDPDSGPGSGAVDPGAPASTTAAAVPPPDPSEVHTVAIDKPAPKLDAVLPVTIQITSWCPGWFLCQRRTVTPLILHEATKRAKLTSVGVRQVGRLTHGGAAVAVELTGAAYDGDDATTTIAPGREAVVRLRLVGEPPKGTTTGQLAIEADQLDDSIDLVVTIERRWWVGMIFFLFLAGGIAGWAVRGWSKRALEAETLARRADEQRTILRGLAARSRSREREQANQALVALDATPLTAPMIDQAAATAEKITTAHTTQLGEQREKLETLARAAQPSTLAAQIGLPIAEQTPRVEAVELALYELDVAKADRGLAALAQAFEARRAAYDAFADAARAAVASLRIALADYAPELRTPWAAAEPALARLAAEQTVDAAIATHRDAIAALAVRADTAADSAVAIAAAARLHLTHDPTLAATIADAVAGVAAATGLTARIAALAAAFAAIRAPLAQRIATARDQGEALAAQADPAAQAQGAKFIARADAVDAAMQAGDWAAVFTGVNGLADNAQGGDVPAVLETPQPTPLANPLAPSPGAPYRAPAIPARPRAALTIHRNAQLARGLQAAFAFAVLPLLACVAYAGSFIGTAGECVAIAATGFVTDFTLEAVITRATALKKE